MYSEEYRKKIKIWSIVGAFFIFGLGALWHFMFEFFGDPIWIGWLFPVNESVWEHVKLMFWPAVIFYAIEGGFLWKKTNNFIFAKFIVLFFTPIVNIIIFYTYSGITGYENFIIDSIILFIVTCIQQYISYKLLTREEIWSDKRTLRIAISILGILLLGALLTLWTYLPPTIPLFEHSGTGMYGIIPHSH
jgi:hypothetical protein